MHTPSLFVASVAVLSTFALAEPSMKPKFFFPRQIKKPVFQNSTMTTPPPQPSSQELRRSSSTKSSLSDFVSRVTGTKESTSDSASVGSNFFETLFSTPSNSTSATAAASTSSSAAASSSQSITIVVDPTTFVSSTSESTPSSTSAPDASSDSVGASATTTSENSLDSTTSIIDSPLNSEAPTNIIDSPLTSEAPTTTTSSSGPSDTTSQISLPSVTATDISLPSVTPTATTDSPTYTTAASSAQTTSESDPLPIVLPTVSPIVSSPISDLSSAVPVTTVLPTVSNVISDLSSAVSATIPLIIVLPTASETSPPSSATSSPVVDNSSAVTQTDDSSSAATSTQVSDPTTEVPSSILDLPTIIASLTSAVESAAPTIISEILSAAPSGLAPSTIVLPTAQPTSTPDSTDESTTTATDPPSAATTTSASDSAITFGPGGILTPTDILPPVTSILDGITPTTTAPTDTPTLSPPGANTTQIVIGSTFIPSTSPPVTGAPTSPPTSTPTGVDAPPPSNITETGIPTTVLTGITLPTGPADGSTTATTLETAPGASGFPSVTNLPGINGTAPADGAAPSTAAPTATSRPEVIIPTGTDPGNVLTVPSSIIAASSTTLPPGVSPSKIPMATDVPSIITNPSAPDTPPNESSLCQIGFLYPLNYQFVVDHPVSSSQIFRFLPKGIADGLGLQEEQVIMSNILPLNTTDQLNYVTTIAQVYIPSNMVSTLGLDLHIPTAAIYKNQDPSVFTLINYINPAIPLTPGSMLAGSNPAVTGAGSAASASATSGNGNIFNDGPQQPQSAKAAGTTAGIAVAAVGGSIAYGAAMFLLARRYKNRKTSHRRSRSMPNPSEMRQSALLAGANPAWMTGGRMSPASRGGSSGDQRNSRGSGRTGNSARTAQISAPMMAENSLGWN